MDLSSIDSVEIFFASFFSLWMSVLCSTAPSTHIQRETLIISTEELTLTKIYVGKEQAVTILICILHIPQVSALKTECKFIIYEDVFPNAPNMNLDLWVLWVAIRTPKFLLAVTITLLVRMEKQEIQQWGVIWIFLATIHTLLLEGYAFLPLHQWDILTIILQTMLAPHLRLLFLEDTSPTS